jgi:hypothetical protein
MTHLPFTVADDKEALALMSTEDSLQHSSRAVEVLGPGLRSRHQWPAGFHAPDARSSAR